MKTLIFILLLVPMMSYGQSTFIRHYTAASPWGANSSPICGVASTDSSYFLYGGSPESASNGLLDLFLMKCSQDGTPIWTKTYGDQDPNMNEYPTDMKYTSDNKIVLLSHKNLGSSNTTDIFVVKVDLSGDTLWTKTIGGPLSDYGLHIEETTDLGYIISGHTYNFINPGYIGVYLIKLSSSGNLEWTKTYGGVNGGDQGMAVKQTNDGGFIICGMGEGIGNCIGGGGQPLLIKTDNLGNVEWTGSYGTIGGSAEDVIVTNDGGYLVTGVVSSSGPNPLSYLLKVSSNGAIEWVKGYEYNGYFASESILPIADSTYMIYGFSSSPSNPNIASLLIKVNSMGDILFTKEYTAGEAGNIIKPSLDNGILMVGDGGPNYGGLFIKTNMQGEVGCFVNNNTGVQVTSPTFLYCSDFAAEGTGGVISNTQTKIGTFTPVSGLLCFQEDCNTSSSISAEGMGSYTAPSGAIYTTGGVYTDTIPNAAGCDSIITINLSMSHSGIGELNNSPKQLIKIVDVLGRETPFKPNTPLLYIYNDGTVERKMIIKE